MLWVDEVREAFLELNVRKIAAWWKSTEVAPAMPYNTDDLELPEEVAVSFVLFMQTSD